MFAIPTRKDLFEIGKLCKHIDNSKQMQCFFKQLSSLLLMIDYFRFNQKIGL